MRHLKEVAGSQATIVIGGDLALTLTDDRRITLHSRTPRGYDELGTFDDVRAAWAAVDRIDLEARRTVRVAA